MSACHFLSRILSYQFFLILSLLFITNSAESAESEPSGSEPSSVTKSDVKADKIPDFMRIVVTNEGPPPSKDQIAFDDIYVLNEGMFQIYNKSSEIYKKHFRERQNLIMGLFSGSGGRFILYRAGKPPIEAESPPAIYRIAKSVGHCAMATYDLLAPYVSDSAVNQAWKGDLQAYHTRVQSAISALDNANVTPDDRKLLLDTLMQIESFMSKCLQNGSFTYNDVETFAREIQPDLVKLITLASSTQVGHWYKVLENWREILGKDWANVYAISNSIYVARQNNILFSVLAQFMSQEEINDRLILLETTDFTTTPEAMMDAFIRIVSDRALGKVFYNDYRLMDSELLGSGGRKAIEAEAAKRGLKPILPPIVPFNSTEWPWKDNPASGTGPGRMEDEDIKINK